MDETTALVPTTASAAPTPPVPKTDDQVVRMWLHGRSAHTQRAYRADADRFRAFVGVTLHECGLADLQAFADSLDGLADATRARRLASVRSLFTFAHRTGYLPFNVGAPLRIPSVKNRLTERILEEQDVIRMIDREPSARNRAILTLFYGAGIRLSELEGLRWRDLQARGSAGQIAVLGKGAKTRHVLVSPNTWALVGALRKDATDLDGPVFVSRERGRLTGRQIERVVRAAAVRVGIDVKKRPVSPHWLRHSHASHALDRGAPVHLVQATLGHESLATTGRYAHARPTESSSRFLPV